MHNIELLITGFQFNNVSLVELPNLVVFKILAMLVLCTFNCLDIAVILLAHIETFGHSNTLIYLGVTS